MSGERSRIVMIRSSSAWALFSRQLCCVRMFVLSSRSCWMLCFSSRIVALYCRGLDDISTFNRAYFPFVFVPSHGRQLDCGLTLPCELPDTEYTYTNLCSDVRPEVRTYAP